MGAAGVLGLSTTAGVVLVVLGATIAIAAGGALLLRGRQREAAPDIPGAMQPGPSDPALEAPLLHKLQGWGVLLVAFFAVWVPFTWLVEPSTNLDQEGTLLTEAIERGRRGVELFSEENQLGVGCVRCHGPELRGGVITNGVNADGSTRYAYPPNLTNICAGPFGNPAHTQILSIQDIYTTIEQGRIAAGMPSWSIRYQGALNDQQINDIVNYLVWLSSENVPFRDNICLNENAVERAQEQFGSGEATA